MTSKFDAAALRSPSSGFRVTSSGAGARHVSLWGALPVGWLSNFTQQASRLHLDIVRGEARRADQQRWSGEFELLATGGAPVEQIDFLSLAREPSPGPASSRLELLGFELTRSRVRTGALELRVHAWDRVGFLASLLGHLAGFVLFPEEIRIETHERQARDSLWLSSVGGQSPPLELEGALRASLLGCLEEKSSSAE